MVCKFFSYSRPVDSELIPSESRDTMNDRDFELAILLGFGKNRPDKLQASELPSVFEYKNFQRITVFRSDVT